MGLRLRVLKGERKDECFELESSERVVIGRGINTTIQIFDHGLSRVHFAIERRNEHFVLRDLDSSNGTFLNGRRIREAVLRAGDHIVSGETEFRVLDGSESGVTTIRVSAEEHQSTVDYIRRKKPHIEGLTSDILLAGQAVEDEAVHKSLKALTTMYKVGNAIQSERDPRRLFQVILDMILEVIQADRGFLLLDQEDSDVLDAVAYRVDEGTSMESLMSISRTIVDESIKNGLSTISSDAMSDQRFQSQDSVCLHNIRSVMCVPLEGQNGILGCIYVDNQASKGVFSEDQLELLSAIGRQAGIALERALLEEGIRKSEGRYRSFIENSPDAIVETSLDGKILSYNEQALKTFGYTPEEMRKLPAGGLYFDASARQEILDLYQEKGFLRNHEIVFQTAGGKRFIGSVSGRLVQEDKAGGQHIESIIRDISKRKGLEDALIKTEERYRETFQRAPAVIATVDVEGIIDQLNDFGCQSIGLSHREVHKGRIHVSEVFGLAEEMARLLTTGEGFEAAEVPVLRRKSKSTVYFDVRGAPFLDAEGRVTGGVVLAKDITGEKELQSQVLQQEKMASIGLLAAGIAHEFNNILASMMGYAQLAGRKHDFDFEKFRDVVLKQTARGKQIVDSLMSFSRQGVQERAFASVNEVLEDCLLLVQKEIEKNNVTLSKDLGDIPRTMFNVGEVQQVFLNLLINASQAMAGRGRGTLTIRSHDDGTNIYVDFSDTGHGIPRSQLSRIFQPFFTTKGPIGKSKTPGTGLGLSVSYNLIQKHGGTIVVESEVGQGSTFTIHLPINEPRTESARRRVDRPDEEIFEPDLGLSILVVDDERPILEVFEGFFEKNDVKTVASGREAILEFARRRYDLVFLDIMMPGEFNGLETLDRLKTINPSARIVLMTAQVENERLTPYLEKVEGLIRKPFSNREIYKILKP